MKTVAPLLRYGRRFPPSPLKMQDTHVVDSCLMSWSSRQRSVWATLNVTAVRPLRFLTSASAPRFPIKFNCNIIVNFGVNIKEKTNIRGVLQGGIR